MKSSIMIPLVLGVVVGLVAIKFGVDAIQRAQGEPAKVITTVTARTDIPASAEITEEMVVAVETPATPLIPEGAFSRAEDVVGRVTAKSVPQGSVIAPLSLAPPGTPPGLTERIEEGYRAVSVKIDEVSGVAGQIKPGDYVDVIVVMRVRRGPKDETISRIILQRVKVVAVGQNLAATADGGSRKPAKSVTLLVRDVDAPKLHLAQTQGKVTLAMRGMDDRMLADTGFSSTTDWSGDGPDAAAGASPASAPPTTPAEQVLRAVSTPVPTPESTKKPFEVTVVLGPLRAEGTAVVQRIVYEDPKSMRVVNVEVGRSGQGHAASADSAESILRRPARRGRDDDRDRPSNREYEWLDGTEEPEDREIAEE